MKAQDIVFLIVILGLLYFRNQKLSIGFGILAYLAAIPLFANWIFFTADRLVMYATAFVLIALLIPNRHKGTVK